MMPNSSWARATLRLASRASNVRMSCCGLASSCSSRTRSTWDLPAREWRKVHRLHRYRLDDMPDWSYTDGRGPGPVSSAQRYRYERDQELARVVVQRIRELQEAKQSSGDQ